MRNRLVSLKKITDNPHLNFYEMKVLNKKQKEHPYYMATRMKEGKLKAMTGEYPPDGIVIYGVHQEEGKEDRLVLIRQFRYPINDYIYELPAGLIDEGETPNVAAMREYWEETGLTLHPLNLDDSVTKPFYTTVGMTDESVCTAFGYATGTVSSKGLEENEDISVVLADRAEVKRILKEEKVAVKCAYLMLHFLNSKEGEPFGFLKDFIIGD